MVISSAKCCQTAILTFVDNVAILGIENCLLYPLQRIFTSQVVNDMEVSQIQSLAAEPSYVTEERKRLSQELEKLQAGLRTLNLFKPMSIDGLSIFGVLPFGFPGPDTTPQ
jgi:hypothetical protein